MRRMQTTVYSFAAPLLFALPVMSLTISGVGDYLRGMEFRQFAGELLIQVTTGVVDALIFAVAAGLFGVQLA